MYVYYYLTYIVRFLLCTTAVLYSICEYLLLYGTAFPHHPERGAAPPVNVRPHAPDVGVHPAVVAHVLSLCRPEELPRHPRAGGLVVHLRYKRRAACMYTCMYNVTLRYVTPRVTRHTSRKTYIQNGRIYIFMYVCVCITARAACTYASRHTSHATRRVRRYT